MMKKNQKGIAHLALFLSLAILAVIGFVGWRVWSANNNGSAVSNSSQSSAGSDGDVVFSENMFDPSSISHIGPLGELNGGYEEAQTISGILINIKPDAVSGGKEIEVRAPAAMSLESYSYHTSPEDGQNNWTLIFKLSSSAQIKFDHITRASEKIMAATTSTPKSDSREESPKNKLSLKAGEVFAYTTGTSLAHNWNIYAYDNNHKNRFVNQARYEADQVGKRLINAVCPFGYYPQAMKSAYIALMGQYKAGQAGNCGEVSRDKQGTLSGMWHFSNDTKSGVGTDRDGNHTSPLSIYKNSGQTVIIHQFADKRIDIEPDNPTYKDPAEVTGEHCYQNQNQQSVRSGYAFFKVSGDQMSAAYSPSGTCPASFSAGAAKTYYR